MKNMSRVSLVALLAFIPALAQAESLNEAVQMTVTSHPKVGVVVNDRGAIGEEANQARGLFRPSVDLRGDAGLGWSHHWGLGNNSEVDDNDILPYFAGNVTLRQMLFDGFESPAELKRQKERERSAGHRVKETAEITGLDTVEAYLNVLRARQLLQIADENLSAHRGLQADIGKRKKGGAGTQGDVDQADARVAQAEALRIEVEGDLRDAEARYNNLVGQFPGDLTRPAPAMDLMPTSLEDALSSAINNNPTIAARTADVSVAKAELRKTKAGYYPRVDFEANAGRSKDLEGIRTTKDVVTGGLVATWNLYRGGADSARDREFQWRQAEAQSELDDARRQVEQDMRQAWAARDAARARAEKYAQQAKANEGVLSAYEKQFTAGDRTLLDVLDAQNELFVSKLNMISAYYTALFGDYQVLTERGALLASLNVAAPGEIQLSEAK